MGKIQEHLPVKLFCGFTYQSSIYPEDIHPILEDKFSGIALISTPYDFSRFTDYYQSEMGQDLKKQFIVFNGLVDPIELVMAKITTNLVEKDFIRNDCRMINLDPGYITQAKLVLATTKNYSHRIYLGRGIYGDVHMHFQKGRYRPNPWTYPDYESEINVEFFSKVRELYLTQLGNKTS
jgi:hypothetical protein